MPPPTIATVDLGDAVRVEARIRDPASDLLVNATVSGTARSPVGVEVPLTVGNLDTGVYELFWTPDLPGRWLVKLSIAGAHVAVEYGLVRVLPAP